MVGEKCGWGVIILMWGSVGSRGAISYVWGFYFACFLWGVFLCPLGRVPLYYVKNVVAMLGGGWLIVDAWYGCVHGFQVCRSILTIRVIMGCTASCWVGWWGLCVCLCWEWVGFLGLPLCGWLWVWFMVSMSSETTSLAQWITSVVEFWFIGWANHVVARFDDSDNPKEPNRMSRLCGE